MNSESKKMNDTEKKEEIIREIQEHLNNYESRKKLAQQDFENHTSVPFHLQRDLDMRVWGLSPLQIYFLKAFYETQTGKKAEDIQT